MRARAAACDSVWCARSCSAICQPTVYTGVSAVIGSWKIIAISLPRTSRISRCGSCIRSRPRSSTSPVDDRVRVADQPHHGHHRDGLAGARLADDPDDVVDVDVQREAVDGVYDAALGAERDVQVADLEQTASGTTHPRVEESVDEVDDRVRDDDEERGVDDGRQDHRQVEVLQRVEGQLADAVQAEHDLREQRAAADERAEVEPEER